MRAPATLIAAMLIATPAAAQDGMGHDHTAATHLNQMGGRTVWKVMADRMEVKTREGREDFVWEGAAWWGGDYNRLWFETEGETGLERVETGEASVELAYSRAVSAFFDVQAGARYDLAPEGRTAAMVGLQGLAPYWFEVDLEAWMDTEGDVRGAMEVEYDLLLTQSLVLQPRAEAEIAAQDIPELGLGAGFTEISIGARLRYDIRREFGPYVGVEWSRPVGETAQIRAAGEDPGGVAALAGVRVWF